MANKVEGGYLEGNRLIHTLLRKYVLIFTDKRCVLVYLMELCNYKSARCLWINCTGDVNALF